MATRLTEDQLRTLEIVERCSSALSVLGCAAIIGAFCWLPQFRNPMHRLIFLNAFYNLFDITAIMISLDGPRKGNYSALCQFQGFLMQMYVWGCEHSIAKSETDRQLTTSSIGSR